MCVMCSTSVPTLFQYFFYDHIPTFLYIFHEMFFITCYIMCSGIVNLPLSMFQINEQMGKLMLASSAKQGSLIESMVTM